VWETISEVQIKFRIPKDAFSKAFEDYASVSQSVPAGTLTTSKETDTEKVVVGNSIKQSSRYKKGCINGTRQYQKETYKKRPIKRGL